MARTTPSLSEQTETSAASIYGDNCKIFDLKAHFIGVDVGTGSARACIIDHKGEILGYATENIRQWQSQEGFCEQSTNDIWQSVCKAVKLAILRSGIDSNSVHSIAFTATCSLTVFSHDTNEPISVTGPNFDGSDHNVVLWMDGRAYDEAKMINETRHELLKYLGGGVSLLMELPKVLWFKRNMPVQLFDRCKFYDLNDALAHIATEPNSIPCTPACNRDLLPLGIDGTVKGWQREFLEVVGLGDLADDDFKRVGGVCKHGRCVPAGVPVGKLCETAARDLGIPTSVVVGSGLIDSYAGWVGTIGAPIEASSNHDDFPLYTRMALVAGTSTCHTVVSREPVFVNGIWGPYENFVIPGYWMSEGGQVATGHLLQHVLEIHPAYGHAILLAKSKNLSIFEFLNRQLRQMQADTNAPNICYIGRYFFFYGDFFGNRSPIADPMMSGSVVGITGDKSLKNLVIHYYGAVEFLALQTRQIIWEMNNAGHSIASIFMSGSQCQNETLVSLIATACNIPVITPRYTHAAVCYGAATLAVKAATMDRNGNTEGIWSVMKRLGQPGKLFEPIDDEDMKKLLDIKYKIFLEQCERQQVFRNMVDQVATKGN